MLPALDPQAPSLADVLASCLKSLSGRTNRLALPAVQSAIVLLVDGLGAHALGSNSGHARTLAVAMGKRDVMQAGFPTTTAAAIASLSTGLPPGQHGLVGYEVMDPRAKRVVNQLSGWDDSMAPTQWQPHATLFETAAAEGFRPLAIGHPKFADSGFSQAVLRGADYLGVDSVAGRIQLAVEQSRTPGTVSYVYVPELDQAGHAAGWRSDRWLAALEETDAGVRAAFASLGARTGALVTADHGMIDIPAHGHILIDQIPGLLDGVQAVAGEPRCLQLHLAPGADPAVVAENWHRIEGERAWVATRAQAVAASWFGEVRAEVLPRIGDVLVAARKAVAYYLTGSPGLKMVGQHGSWSAEELQVPLLRFGGYAR